jgi:NAD(P)-dependent dehydrogenase (short-subunit alcohol dehydrogenase family)
MMNNNLDMTSKVAMVTGANSGIGLVTARALADRGATVVLVCRDRERGEAALTEIKARSGNNAVELMLCDLASQRSIREFAEEFKRTHDRLDVLVNNAGILGPRAPIVAYPIDAWEEGMQINVNSVFILTQAVLRLMTARRQGSIINVSSGVGRIGKARWGAYAVSKFAIEGLTQVLADELKEGNIRANAVNPGGTRTAMRAEAYPEEDPATLPKPEEITPVFVYLASDDSATVTGQSLDAREWIKK